MRVKIVRDRMVIGKGGTLQPVNSKAGKMMGLLLKLHEEADEISRGAECPEEYADLLEVMLEIARMNDVSWADIEAALLRKREERGAFQRGMVWVKE